MRVARSGLLAVVVVTVAAASGRAQPEVVPGELAPGFRRAPAFSRRAFVQPVLAPASRPVYTGTVGVNPGAGLGQASMVGPGWQPSLVAPGLQPSLAAPVRSPVFFPAAVPVFVPDFRLPVPAVNPFVPPVALAGEAAPVVPFGPADLAPARPAGQPLAATPQGEAASPGEPVRGTRGEAGRPAARPSPLGPLFDPDVLGRLDLTEAQQRRLQELGRRTGREAEQLRRLEATDPDGARRRWQDLRGRAVAEAGAVLTESQRQAWSWLSGEPVGPAPRFSTAAR